jgi:IclR family pca regulon transcriptional regulator
LLAFLPAEQLQAALANMNWLQRTETTLSTPQALMDNLVLVRSRGFADSDGEMIPELQAVAAPIHQNNGQVVATVNISAPSHRVTHEKMVTEFAPEVVETAQKISMALGYYSEHKI